jgi:ADP-ribosylglycohydrolase
LKAYTGFLFWLSWRLTLQRVDIQVRNHGIPLKLIGSMEPTGNAESVLYCGAALVATPPEYLLPSHCRRCSSFVLKYDPRSSITYTVKVYIKQQLYYHSDESEAVVYPPVNVGHAGRAANGKEVKIMLGAMIGDIVGSIYEWNGIKTKDFPLFRDNCSFTDDTVMTVATADALMNGGGADDFIDAYKEWGRRYYYVGYGDKFRIWIHSDDRSPYKSWGNGSAMRVSPCAWLMDCGYYARTGICPSRELAKLSAEVTHNHPEGIKGALAVTDAIFLCRFYMGGYKDGSIDERTAIEQCKLHVKEHIEKEYGYDLSKTLDEIRPAYSFDASCQGTVPQAIIAFLESADFEDAIRNAVSLGGHSDTLAAITGSIAEAAYGIPQWIKDKAWSYLDGPIREVCCCWQAYIEKQGQLRSISSDSRRLIDDFICPYPLRWNEIYRDLCTA